MALKRAVRSPGTQDAGEQGPTQWQATEFWFCHFSQEGWRGVGWVVGTQKENRAVVLGGTANEQQPWQQL